MTEGTFDSFEARLSAWLDQTLTSDVEKCKRNYRTPAQAIRAQRRRSEKRLGPPVLYIHVLERFWEGARRNMSASASGNRDAFLRQSFNHQLRPLWKERSALGVINKRSCYAKPMRLSK